MDSASKQCARAARFSATSPRLFRRAPLLVGLFVSAALLVAALSTPTWASTDPTTTTSAPTTTTTTTAPTTTTSSTSPPTTRTTPVSRPTTTVPATSSTSTTTTTLPKTHSTSSDTWVLVVIAVAAALVLALLIGVLVGGRRRRRANSAWLPSARTALDSAVAARDLLLSEPADADAATHEAIRAKVGEAARMLDGASARGPDEEARTASHDAAEELRGLLFAVEAQRLLPTGRTPPTADQLAQADLQRRTRESELERALVRLGRRVRTVQ
ncbi:MAG: hypothetical protein WB565_10560 [Acidimicrobiales bacterium]